MVDQRKGLPPAAEPVTFSTRASAAAWGPAAGFLPAEAEVTRGCSSQPGWAQDARKSSITEDKKGQVSTTVRYVVFVR